MVIHVVGAGDSLYSISRRYGVRIEQISEDNGVDPSQSLVIGQTIVVMTGTRRYTVKAGESLDIIARRHGTTVASIQAANQINNPESVSAGTTITVPSGEEKLGTLEVNGCAFPGIKTEVLRKTLPYLTYLSIFCYEAKPDGSLGYIDDADIIREARAARVAPLMVVSNLHGGRFNSDTARLVLTDERVQDALTANIVNTLKAKNYVGLEVDFEYIYPENRENYNGFLRKLNEKLKPLGYLLMSSVAPKASADYRGLPYEAHDYPVHGKLSDHIRLMTYELGHAYGPPKPVAPIAEVRKTLQYAASVIPRQKVFMGIPNYGYDWILPHEEGKKAEALTNTGAVSLARRVGAAIQYDQKAQVPFFKYFDDNRKEHIVWFEDARSIEAKLRLMDQYYPVGAGYWTIGSYFPQNWLVLGSLYDVRKVQ